ncbi:MAG TPA: DUF4348 domain-containing protein [Longimicrobiales bacterium]|nr:DUF4348 domain-containing protein [Longimicrobiales bacterium]
MRAWLLKVMASLVIAATGVHSRGLSAQQAPRPAAAAAREDFREFFDRFRQDSVFQAGRTRFPLPWFSQADDATRRLTRRDWTFVPFYTGQETYTQVFDNFAMRLADTDERVYALIGVASDIRQNYYFRRAGGKWFLVRVEDLSM